MASISFGIFFPGQTYEESGIQIVNGLRSRYRKEIEVPPGIVAVQVISHLPSRQSEIFREGLKAIFDLRIHPPKGGPV